MGKKGKFHSYNVMIRNTPLLVAQDKRIKKTLSIQCEPLMEKRIKNRLKRKK